jgi:hypothetical protein
MDRQRRAAAPPDVGRADGDCLPKRHPRAALAEIDLAMLKEDPFHCCGDEACPNLNGAPVRAKDSPVGDGLAATRLCPVNVGAFEQAMERAVKADEADNLAECENALTEARRIVDRLKPPRRSTISGRCPAQAPYRAAEDWLDNRHEHSDRSRGHLV